MSDTVKLREKYKLYETYGACPEAYDVHLDGHSVATMRLRHGYFHVDVGLETVFDAHPRGDGLFDHDERAHYIHRALRAIDDHVDPAGLHGKIDPDDATPAAPEAEFEP